MNADDQISYVARALLPAQYYKNLLTPLLAPPLIERSEAEPNRNQCNCSEHPPQEINPVHRGTVRTNLVELRSTGQPRAAVPT